jgi:hypothetical protein
MKTRGAALLAAAWVVASLLAAGACADSRADATNPFATPATSRGPAAVVSVPVVINEIDPSGDPADWVELKNQGTAPVDLGGFALGQGYDGLLYPSADSLVLLPVGTTIAPGAHLVVATSPGADAGPGGFGVSKSKAERVTLFDRDQAPVDDTTTDGSAASPIPKGTTWARVPDGTGPFGRHGATEDAPNEP